MKRTEVNLIETEKAIANFVEKHHKCPWWIRIFKKPYYSFVFIQSNKSGIGKNTIMKCTKCGKRYDITDYNAW